MKNSFKAVKAREIREVPFKARFWPSLKYYTRLAREKQTVKPLLPLQR
jgi:hypothetical protein